jgi:hypothetical protein
MNYFQLNMPVRLLVFVFLNLIAASGLVQAFVQSDQIKISGHVTDIDNSAKIPEDLMVVNLTTQQGVFGKAGGNFLVTIGKNDTLLIAATGYEYKKICFKDSLTQAEYHVSVKLSKLSVQLKEVEVFSPRDLEAIQKDIQKLGYNRRDYQLSGIDGLQSPITFLYEQFSRHEQLRRHNAEIVNEERKRQLLKELLTRYVADDIVQLSTDEFDRFVDFCNVPENFMKTSTQYEFIVYIKQKYRYFSQLYDYYREK